MIGEIELTGDALDLAGDGLTMIAYSAERGSQAEDQLKLLATSTPRRVRLRPSPPELTDPPPSDLDQRPLTTCRACRGFRTG